MGLFILDRILWVSESPGAVCLWMMCPVLHISGCECFSCLQSDRRSKCIQHYVVLSVRTVNSCVNGISVAVSSVRNGGKLYSISVHFHSVRENCGHGSPGAFWRFWSWQFWVSCFLFSPKSSEKWKDEEIILERFEKEWPCVGNLQQTNTWALF